MTSGWSGEGPAFQTDWGGRPWTLRVDGPRPGLVPNEGDGDCRLLGLMGVAEPGRWDREALSASSLVAFATRRGRVEALYQPQGWWDLSIRASWSVRDDESIDLEVQVSTLSVGKLRRIEVFALNAMAGGSLEEGPTTVEPHDARAAGLTYDGREPELSGLTTGPPGPSLPELGRLARFPGSVYAGLAHPQDVTRKLRTSEGLGENVRYGLFGHDLEKGVVLRARLRGLWLAEAGAQARAEQEFAAFLAEPPPLLT